MASWLQIGSTPYVARCASMNSTILAVGGRAPLLRQTPTPCAQSHSRAAAPDPSASTPGGARRRWSSRPDGSRNRPPSVKHSCAARLPTSHLLRSGPNGGPARAVHIPVVQDQSYCAFAKLRDKLRSVLRGASSPLTNCSLRPLRPGSFIFFQTVLTGQH